MQLLGWQLGYAVAAFHVCETASAEAAKQTARAKATRVRGKDDGMLGKNEQTANYLATHLFRRGIAEPEHAKRALAGGANGRPRSTANQHARKRVNPASASPKASESSRRSVRRLVQQRGACVHVGLPRRDGRARLRGVGR